MSSIDYELAKNEIEQRFEKASHRTVVFWYDESKSFQELVEADQFENAKVIIFNNNEFSIRHKLEIEDLKSNYLIYFPCARPRDRDNWLLDILLYSEEYYADEVALIMRKLDLSNSYLRKIIENHIKFFKSESRINDLRKQVTISDQLTESDFLHGMMAALVKSKSIKIEAILTELIFDLMSESKYREIRAYGFEEYLWTQIAAYTNYSGEQSILLLVKNYMMTAVAKTSRMEDYSSFYRQYIIDSSNQASNDALLLVDNIKNDIRYTQLQSFIAEELKIRDLIQNRGIDDLGNCDVFEIFDVFIVNSILDSLSTGSLDHEFFENIILNNRINSFWYKKHQTEYESILKLINFKKALDIPIYDNLTSEEYIKLYKDKIYQVDLYFRHSLFLLNKIEEYEDTIYALKERLNNQYEVFLNHLGSKFSNSLEKKNSWNFYGEIPLFEFYQEIQKITFKKMFVIISDALRYEIATELHDRIKSDAILKGQTTLTSMIAPLPSITKLGMASLLPHKTIEYGKDVLVDKVSSTKTIDRDAILKSRNESYAAIRFEDINNMNRAEIREYMRDKSLVYIYHNTIDNTGERKENRVFEAANDTIDEILSLIKRLYNSLQISNFLVTADHGFLYREFKVNDSLKYNDVSKLNPKELSRRYAIVEDDSSVPYTLKFPVIETDENKQSVIIPYSYNYFKSSGGVQYVHGGASLQEIVVPLLKISELRGKTINENIGQVGVRIKSLNRTITQRSFTIDFEQYEKVAGKKIERKLVTYFVDDKGQDVSGRYSFIANSNSDDLTQRVSRIRFTLSNIEFNRDRRYYLILKDDNQNESEYIEKEVFKIDILGFKAFF